MYVDEQTFRRQIEKATTLNSGPILDVLRRHGAVPVSSLDEAAPRTHVMDTGKQKNFWRR